VFVASQLVALVASAGLVGAGLATAGQTRAFEALPALASATASAAGDDQLCRVDVIRSGNAGSAVVNRIEERNRCVCVVTTGPKDRNGSAEGIVEALLRDRTCDGAPAPAPAAVAETAASAGGGASGAIIGVVLAVGVGVALTAGGGGGGGNDSAG
jgi:hypothetical protein